MREDDTNPNETDSTDTGHWLAREKAGDLVLYRHRPTRSEEHGIFLPDPRDLSFQYIYGEGLFPEVTWENSPARLAAKTTGK